MTRPIPIRTNFAWTTFKKNLINQWRSKAKQVYLPGIKLKTYFYKD